MLLRDLRTGCYQMVVVFRLDRLGRRLLDSIMLFDELDRQGIEVCSITEGIDPTTAGGRLAKNLILSFAEYERDSISEATRERLAAARAAGKQLGRRPISKRKRREIQGLRSRGLTFREIKAITHISIGTISNILKEKTIEQTRKTQGE
jgi:DNA invertase Pin-like site-specific DNA recombinase